MKKSTILKQMGNLFGGGLIVTGRTTCVAGELTVKGGAIAGGAMIKAGKAIEDNGNNVKAGYTDKATLAAEAELLAEAWANATQASAEFDEICEHEEAHKANLVAVQIRAQNFAEAKAAAQAHVEKAAAELKKVEASFGATAPAPHEGQPPAMVPATA